jgi:hypothetical protein
MMKALSLFVLICFVPTVSYAHPPEKVEVAINPDKKVLAVYVTHKTDDVAKHSVKKVSLSLNGTDKIVQKISRQDDETGLMVNYRLPEVVPGDDVEVRAVCDTGGETSGKLKVE